MRNFMELLILASVYGSVLGLIILILRKVFWKQSRPSFWYYLWILVAIRLLLPLEAPISTITIPTASSSAPAVSTPVESSVKPPEAIAPESPAREIQAPELTAQTPTYTPPSTSQDTRKLPKPQLITVLFTLWIIIAGGRLFVSIVRTIRFKAAVHSATNAMEQSARLQRLASEASLQVGLSAAPAIYEIKGISIPLQIGLWKPSVLLPEHTQDASDIVLRHIILHELIHCKRRDILYKWLVQLFVCFHWFNPLVYWFRHQISTDCELSCDAAVLRLLNADEHTAYGEMLLTAADSRNNHMPAGSVMLSEDARTLRRRLAQIAGYSRQTKPLAVLSALIVVVLLVCGFVAGPSREKETPPQVPYRSPVHQILGLNDPRDIARDFEVYEPFGLTHSLEYNRLYFKGELVRYFEDIESETSYKQWAMPDGAVDVYAERGADGTLIGVKQFTQVEFDKRTHSINDYPHAYTHSVTNSVTNSTRNQQPAGELGERLPGESDSEYYGRIFGEYYGKLYGEANDPYTIDNSELLARIYEEYKPYGLIYKPEEDRLYCNGKLVKFFSDLPDGGAGTSNNRYFGPYPDGEVTVTAQRDASGKLTGLTVRDATNEDGAGVDWRSFIPQWSNSPVVMQDTAAEVTNNRGVMTKSMPIGDAKNIEIIAPTCQLSLERSDGDSIEAVFAYPNELEPNYTKYVELVINKTGAKTAVVETKFDNHGFDPIPGMDIEEEMGYQAKLTVKIPDKQYDSITISLLATARDDLWDIPLDIRSNTLNIRSVANNVRFIANVEYDSIHITNTASELYFVTRTTGKYLTIENKFGSVNLTLLEEPQNIVFDLSEVDVAEIPESWRKNIEYDAGGSSFYRKGSGTNKASVTNDRGRILISVL